ncbi:DUF5681 domain-containing protein [Phenylobacterium deserti]|uniref:DUF5681 domain-containing protein n=1 Tax=Phenylobacterium deserti TaxID=1914756 RepID=UPI001057F820|nr:DUF5681 domain-containing protein [Phenylobacterium deserti]
MADQPENTGRKQATQFKPGQSGNPNGRPKGSRNKLNEDFVRALSDDFAEHGDAVIAAVRSEKPDVYLKVVASLSPKHVEVKDERLDDLERDELAAFLDAVREARRAREADSEGAVH